MVEQKLPKLTTRVRFPSPAPVRPVAVFIGNRPHRFGPQRLLSRRTYVTYNSTAFQDRTAVSPWSDRSFEVAAQGRRCQKLVCRTLARFEVRALTADADRRYRPHALGGRRKSAGSGRPSRTRRLLSPRRGPRCRPLCPPFPRLRARRLRCARLALGGAAAGMRVGLLSPAVAARRRLRVAAPDRRGGLHRDRTRARRLAAGVDRRRGSAHLAAACADSRHSAPTRCCTEA